MFKLKQIISLSLVFFILFTAVSPALTVFAEELPGADRMRDSYPTGNTYQNPVGNWSYQYAVTGTNNYINFDAFYNTTPAWGDLPWSFIKDGDITELPGGGIESNWQHPIISNMRALLVASHDAVYTYTAPRDGVIDITNNITIFGDPNWPGGVEFTVYKKTGDQYVAIGPVQTGSEIYTLKGAGQESYALSDMTTAVKAGETLHFQLKSLEIGAGYGATIDPVVTYISGEYDASQDLGLLMAGLPGADRMRDSYPVNTYQNPVGNWSYQYAATGTNNYVNFDSFVDTTVVEPWNGFPWGFIKDGDVILDTSGGGNHTMTWNTPVMWNVRTTFGHPHMNDAVYTYTAPRDGVIEITNMIVVHSVGVHFTVYKKTGDSYTAIGPESTGSATYTANQTLPMITTAVKAGETIHFQLNGTNVGDGADIDPVVTYISGEYDAGQDLGLLMAGLPGADRMQSNYPVNNTYQNPVGNWSYQYAATGTNNYVNFDAFYDITPVWFDLPWSFIKDEDITELPGGGFTTNWQHPIISNMRALLVASHDAVYTYTAPRDGVIDITNNITIFGDPNWPGGVEFTVYKKTGDQYVAIGPVQTGSEIYTLKGAGQESYALSDMTTAVKAGETLHFQLKSLEIGAGYGATIDPVVTYTSDTYDAGQDLGLARIDLPGADRMQNNYPVNTYQNPVGNWSYQYAATGTNNYINFDAFYDTTPAWGDLPWSFIKDGDITELPGGGIESSWQHPIISNRRAWLINAFDAVYTYTAPRDGTITVTNTITVFGDPNWVNPPGVELTVYKKTGGQYVAVGPGQTGSEIYALKGSDHESYTPEAMTTAIKAGETLHFQLKNANRGPWHNAAIDPRIVYLTGIYNENDDLGITTLSPRIDRPAGSDLDTSAYPVTAGGEFVYSGEIEADEILDGVINGTLPSGAYTVKNNRTLVMDLSDITIDFSGLKFIVEPDGESHGEEGEKRFALYLAENQNLFIKNLTLEVKGTPAAVIAGDGFNNVTFTGIEIIDSNNLPGGAEINLLSVQGGAGQSDFVFDALRFESKDNKINKMAIGVQASTAVIKNSYIDGVFIDDNSYAGARIENNILKNTGDVLNLNSNSTAIYNTIESADGAGVTSSGKINILAALNIIESSSGGVSVRLENVTNGVLLLNRLKQISAQNSTNITVAENTFAGGGVNFENVNYALGTGNAGMTAVTGSNNANLSGSDFVTGTLPAAGVNEDLLPKLNKELFVPMERKTTVGAGILLDVSEYISLNYKTSKYVIIPPGAYSSLPVTLYDRKDYTIYAYGVLCEFENTSATPLLMYDCENIAVKGLYIDYATPPNGQATVVSVSGGAGGRIHFKMDDGYYQDLLDREKFSYKTIELAGTLWFEEGSDIVKNMIEKVPVSEPGEGMFSIPNSSDTPGIKAGDKLAFRGVGTNVTHFEGCSGIMLEDCTVYGGSGFAFSEFLGNNPTILNRFAVVPGPAPKLPGGGRGPERLLSTCDSTHSTDMRYGPQITNCVFESATDDGTNINAQFGGVTGFDAATRTIIYGRGQTAYNGICAAFKEGDRVLIYTVNGELLCDTVATGNTVALGGGVYSVTVEASDITLKEGVTINIQNASASGNNFLIENTRQYGNWTRGFLIKAIGGRISNCTIDSVGCAAIYICPEVTDGYWPECGFSEDIIIEKNLIKNTGYMYSGGLYSTPINITGQVANTKDPNYMMIQRITVRNNVIENRRTMYALHINGAQNIKIENNDWGFMYGRNSNTDTQTGVLISTAMDIELNGNIYPPLAVPKILTDAASTVNIFGTDIGTPASEFVIGGIKSVYNGNGWDIVLELENISNTAQNGTVNIVYITPGIIEDAGSKTYNLTAGETAELVYPVAGLPVNLKSALFSVTYTVDGEDEIIGYLSENLYFNAAVKTNKIPVFGEEPDKIWNNAAPAAAAAKETDPDIYNTSVRFLWDDEYLYMLAEITDPYHHQPSAGEYIWNDGDSIQFAIEPGRSSGTAGQLEIGFALTNTGEISQWCWESSISEHIGDLTGKGFNTVINRDDENKKTVYQIAMPWLFIGLNGSPPQNGDIIAFNLCVNNKDNASDVRTFYEFYGGIANNKNPSEFGLITVLDQVNEIDYKNVIEEALGELLPEVSLNITISGGMVRGIPSRVAVGVIGILPEVREIRGAADFIGTGTVIEFLDGAEITVIIYGDLTGSGYVGMDSVVALARHIAAIKRLDEVFLEAADTNGDNRVNIADLIRLARHHAGVDTSPLG